MVNPVALAADIQAFLGTSTHPGGNSEAAQAWAQAYDSFAQGAEDASGEGPAVVNSAGFEAAVRALFESTGTAGLGPSPAVAAQAFSDAFVAYWTGGTFVFGTPPLGNWSVELSSAVSSVVGSSLKSALQQIFESPSLTPVSTASALAQAFSDATTADVTVLISGLDTTPTPSGPLPITLSDTLT